MLRQRHAALMDRIEWIRALPADFDGVIVANEVLDALPVHLVALRKNGLFKRGVSRQDGFVWSERPLEPGTLRSAAEAIGAEADYVSEIALLPPAPARSFAAALRTE